MSAQTQHRVAAGLAVGVLAGVVIVGVAIGASAAAALPALLALIGGAVLLVRPELGLYASAMVTPVERLGRLTDDSAEFTVSIMRIIGLAAFGAYAIHCLVRRRRLYLPREAWVLGAWVALVAASTAWTSDPTASKRGFGLYAGNLIFFVLLINAVRSRAMARRLIALAITVSAVLGVYSLQQWRSSATLVVDDEVGAGAFATSDRFSGVWIDESELDSLGARKRLAGPTSHPTVYAANLLTLLPLCVWFFHRRLRPSLALLLAASLGVFAVSLMLSGTRAAILTVGVVCLLLVVTRLIPLRAWSIALAIAALAALPFAMPESVVERIFDTQQYTMKESASLGLRMAYWRAGLGVIRENPMLGAGYSNFHEIPRRVPELSPEATTAHNFLIQLWAELGIVGFALFLGFLGMIGANLVAAYRSFRRRGDTSDALLCAAIGVSFVAPMILGISCDWHHFPMKIWWLGVGLSVVLRRIALGEIEEEAPQPILPVLGPAPRSLAVTWS
ncbi:MAG TPA: O-antigen ligase family protein [Myxococcota bacterium]